MKHTQPIALAMMGVLLFTMPAMADSIDGHPDLNVKLGDPFSIRTPFDSRGLSDVLICTDKKIIPGKGFDLDFDLTEVSSYEELHRALNISTSIEANLMFVKGKSATNFSHSFDFSQTTLTLVLRATKVFHADTLEGVLRISKDVAEEVKGYKTVEEAALFIESEGSDVVTSIRRGATIAVIYHFRTTSKESVIKLRQELSAKFKKVDGKFDMAAEVRKIDKSTHYSIQVHQKGANAQSSLSTILNLQPGNVKALRLEAYKALKSTTKENCPIVSFGTKKMHHISGIARTKSMKLFKAAMKHEAFFANRVSGFVGEYLKLLHDIDFMEGFLNKPPYMFKKDGRNKLNELCNKLKARLKTIKGYVADMIDGKQIKFVAGPVFHEGDVCQYMRQPFVLPRGWDKTSPALTCSNERSNIWTNFAPIFDVLHPRLILRINLWRTDTKDSSKRRQDIMTMGLSDIRRVVALQGRTMKVVNGDRTRIQQYSGNVYTWGCHADQKESKRTSYGASHVTHEGRFNYHITVLLIDGTMQTIDLGNYPNPVVQESFKKAATKSTSGTK